MIVIAAPLGGLLGDTAGYGVALLAAGCALVVVAVLMLGDRRAPRTARRRVHDGHRVSAVSSPTRPSLCGLRTA